MFDLARIQAALKSRGVAAWLLVDFRGTNPLARRVVEIPAEAHTTRRWFYLIPAEGPPRKLVHRIEQGVLDHLPGEKQVYLTWQELEAGVQGFVGGLTRVAMEYSPRNAIPYLSKVDAGTVELVRGCGAEVVSSGDIVQEFEATLSPRQWELHLAAERVTTSAYDRAWQFIREEVRTRGGTRETDVQRVIMEHFAAGGCVTDHPPIVGVGPHSGDPHYAPSPDREAWIRVGDFVLVDLWGKMDDPDAIYSDLTRVAFVGPNVPPRIAEIFDIVAAARDAALDAIREACSARRPIQGCMVDRVCRGVIEAAGYGQYFVHRTGHSLGRETHGNGANLDDLETHDERTLLPRTCFTIEPGIYLPEFGVRSEINIYLDADYQVHVTGGPVQTEVLALM